MRTSTFFFSNKKVNTKDINKCFDGKINLIVWNIKTINFFFYTISPYIFVIHPDSMNLGLLWINDIICRLEYVEGVDALLIVCFTMLLLMTDHTCVSLAHIVSKFEQQYYSERLKVNIFILIFPRIKTSTQPGS